MPPGKVALKYFQLSPITTSRQHKVKTLWVVEQILFCSNLKVLIMKKIKKYLLEFCTVIGGAPVLWGYLIKPFLNRAKNVSMADYILQIDPIIPIGIIILVV